MDLSMPELDGVEALRRIRATAPSTRVLLLTAASDRKRFDEARGAGAASCLLKDVAPRELLDAVRAAGAGISSSPMASVTPSENRDHRQVEPGRCPR